MAGAFYPNYLSKRLKPEKELLKDMDCRNHYTTVMVSLTKFHVLPLIPSRAT